MTAAFRLLLALALSLLAHRVGAEPFPVPTVFDQKRVTDVTATALDFMAPRTLEAVSLPVLAAWGLRGLTTLDPSLSVDVTVGEARVRQLLPGTTTPRVIVDGTVPAAGDTAGWSRTIAAAGRAAWNVSAPVRAAGTQGFIQTFFDEVFNHLDPYSRYAAPAEAATDRIRRDGRASLGMTLGRVGDGFVIQAVERDGPAAQAGIRAGDRLLMIDGEDVQGAELEDVVAALAGQEETAISLTVRRRGGAPRTLPLTRVQLVASTVEVRRSGALTVIRISLFARDTADRLRRAMPRDRRAGTGVVIDLRGNRGGLLRQAVAAAGVLLAPGPVARTEGRDPEAVNDFRASGEDPALGFPVIVLVDGRTASAAEIMAAALADRGRAVVVGSATQGKGLVQTVAPLPDGGELFITWSRVLAPLGWPLQGLGLMPQVCTSQGQDAMNRQLTALREGWQPMERILARHRSARAPIPAAEQVEIRRFCPAAEGTDRDLAAAKVLLASPGAYAAALPILPGMATAP